MDNHILIRSCCLGTAKLHSSVVCYRFFITCTKTRVSCKFWSKSPIRLMSLFLQIIQIKFVTKTQSVINGLEHELYKILELVFKKQQNKYDMNRKQKSPNTTNMWSFNTSIVYFLFSYIPIFPSPKNSTKEFMLS